MPESQAQSWWWSRSITLVASWPSAAVGAYMALVPMFTGYLLFGWALAHVPATTATTLTLLEPPSRPCSP